jgi:hypothetical protein
MLYLAVEGSKDLCCFGLHLFIILKASVRAVAILWIISRSAKNKKIIE